MAARACGRCGPSWRARTSGLRRLRAFLPVEVPLKRKAATPERLSARLRSAAIDASVAAVARTTHYLDGFEGFGLTVGRSPFIASKNDLAAELIDFSFVPSDSSSSFGVFSAVFFASLSALARARSR